MAYEQLTRGDLIRLLEQHDAERAEAGKDGIIMSYTGRTAPWQIIRQVKPKLTKIHQRSSVGGAEAQGRNIIMDGENLSAMVTLYKYRGQVDLILTDPPYNTGEDFRYNDKWDKDPNDPDLGDLVPKEDGSRHSKWLRFMTPRLWMMREMLKPGGVIAICIDHRELYRLGMLMDEVFREENRIGIINWQKSYSARSQKHISTATEYVLVYAKDVDRATTQLLDRTEVMNSRYRNYDNDPDLDWKSADASAPEIRETGTYGVQSPFTGRIFYPREGRGHWANDAPVMKRWLTAWGSEYTRKDLGDGFAKALVLKGAKFHEGEPVRGDPVVIKARDAALKILKRGAWPALYFGVDGENGPQLKNYLKDVKRGKVAMTYWADEDYESPLNIESQSWDHTESGHSQTGVTELDAVVGKNHNFRTVKPLRLFKKIIQIWCKSDGIVLDPFAGSGTTAHAVLDLNKESAASRRFILVEQGNDEKGDHYAKSLTADRVRRVIKGDWKSGKREPLEGGFQFIELQRQQVDAAAVNALQREEMIDLLLTVHWDKSDRAKTSLTRFSPEASRRFLFATNARNEGFFLIWDGASHPSILNRDTFKAIVEEAKAYGLMDRYHVYASLAPYSGRTVEFYKIPDRVLEHIGFNTRADAFNNEIAPESEMEQR
ncbi:site-specific DNA-methyltransferase [Variovorax guangxiensis]|uniref:site-specific DNA-methyltransferase (adenine-specific) n=1 Tax=Variovorax guangxiensis TaxID=1775474 RepID=A0A3S0ZE08_9BURK|nr:site-specific DNA-methyltransferase [Variovorax guangxiensis]RUR70990.1 site-specific DNA-methyltransferase [Variovorax guangxiensis]